MLSQLTKTVKMALKSTEEERAILRARSALQRFPVVEWRQRMEDFHKRSINTSRNLAGANAWRESDCDGGGVRPMAETDDWDPVSQAYPSQPDWDSRSINDSPHVNNPGSPGQWSQESFTPVGDQHTPRLHPESQRNSYATDDGDDYFTQRSRVSMANSVTDSPQGYTDFLERANKTIGKDQRHVPDPFVDGGLTPNRPFGAHSRVSSVESISSIVDEKSNSPLNKAIASVSTLHSFPMLLLTIYFFSSPMPMVVLLRSSYRSFRDSMQRTRSMSCPLRNFWSKARKHSLAKSGKISCQVPRACDPPNATLYGVHPHRHSILAQTVCA